MKIYEAPEASMISFNDYGVYRRVFVVVDNGRRFYFDPKDMMDMEYIFALDKECKVEYTLSPAEYQNLKQNIRNGNAIGGILALLGIVAFFTIFILLAGTR